MLRDHVELDRVVQKELGLRAGLLDALILGAAHPVILGIGLRLRLLVGVVDLADLGLAAGAGRGVAAHGLVARILPGSVAVLLVLERFAELVGDLLGECRLLLGLEVALGIGRDLVLAVVDLARVGVARRAHGVRAGIGARHAAGVHRAEVHGRVAEGEATRARARQEVLRGPEGVASLGARVRVPLVGILGGLNATAAVASGDLGAAAHVGGGVHHDEDEWVWVALLLACLYSMRPAQGRDRWWAGLKPQDFCTPIPVRNGSFRRLVDSEPFRRLGAVSSTQSRFVDSEPFRRLRAVTDGNGCAKILGFESGPPPVSTLGEPHTI